MKKKLIKDHVLSEFFLFKLDIESNSKIFENYFYRENIDSLRNKGFFIFLSPRYSNLIRLLSEMSFDFFRILKNPKIQDKIFKTNFFNMYFCIGVSLLNIVIELNSPGPTIKSTKKDKFSKIFSINNFGKKMLIRNFRSIVPNFFYPEFFFLSKGILLESFGFFSNKNYFQGKFSLNFVLSFFRFFPSKEITYNFGLIHLLTLNNSVLHIPGNKLFFKKFFGKISKIPKITRGLYWETSKIILIDFFYLSFFGLFYDRKEKLNFLSKARILINYNFFFTGILGYTYSDQLHQSSLCTFSINKGSKKNCFGKKKKRNFCAKLFKSSFKIRKNGWFYIDSKNFAIQGNKNSRFYQKRIFPKYEIREKFGRIQKKPNFKSIYDHAELYSIFVFFINVGYMKFYKRWSPQDILDAFIKKIIPITIHLPTSLKIFMFIELHKKNKFRKNQFEDVYGAQIENILKFFSKKKKKIYFHKNFHRYYFLIHFQNSFFPKILSSIYKNFSFFDDSFKIYNILEKKKIFFSENIFTKNVHHVEAKILKKRDSIDLRYFTKFFFYIGNLTQNGKYFEVIARKISKEKWLAKKSLAYYFLKKKKYIISKNQYILSLTVFPKDVENWFNLGFVSLKLKDYKTSANCFFKVLKEEPRNHNAWSNLISISSASNFGKKDFIFLKTAIRNEIIPFFILKKYLMLLIDRKKICMADILTTMHKIVGKKITSNSEIFFLTVKITISIIEIKRKMELLWGEKSQIGREIRNFFWGYSVLSNILGFFYFIVKKKMANFLFKDMLVFKKYNHFPNGGQFFSFFILSEEINRVWYFS
jgi:tetratricopeptide (TPR) repeat protein